MSDWRPINNRKPPWTYGGCELFHAEKGTGHCTGVPAARVTNDHGRSHVVCGPMAKFLLHAKGRCSKCRKPLVWCWNVNELEPA